MPRVFDVAVSVTLLLVTAPLLLALWLMIRFTIGKPVIFDQERPGKDGVPFRIFKFRTMTDGRTAEGELLPDRVRLTRFGRLIRATSLDELPELLNVLRGDMALVGPRPLLMEYLPLYSETQSRRHEVRPGLTGWAQVNGRNAITWDERLRLDVWYVDNRSFALDIGIMLKTLWVVVDRRGISAEGHATMPRFTGGESPPQEGHS
jgi:lipopolysaccharide/colanic/teichoic acid biosynthesis glycosyltransferase